MAGDPTVAELARFAQALADGVVPLVIIDAHPTGEAVIRALAGPTAVRLGIDSVDVVGLAIERLVEGRSARALRAGIQRLVDGASIVTVDLPGGLAGATRCRLLPLGWERGGLMILALGEGVQPPLTDDLTGVASRELLTDRWAQAVARARRSHRSVSLLFCDLDGFKHVNDEHGHVVGDEALRLAADRIAGAVRDEDTVARLGGDEFVVIVEDGLPVGSDVAGRIVAAFADADIEVAGRRLTLSVSVGVALTPVERLGDGLAAVLSTADAAMYEAKREGGARFRIAHPPADQPSEGRTHSR